MIPERLARQVIRRQHTNQVIGVSDHRATSRDRDTWLLLQYSAGVPDPTAQRYRPPSAVNAPRDASTWIAVLPRKQPTKGDDDSEHGNCDGRGKEFQKGQPEQGNGSDEAGERHQQDGLTGNQSRPRPAESTGMDAIGA